MIAQIASNVNRHNLWIIDSDCSNHMTGYNSKCITFTDWNGGVIKFGDKSSVKIQVKGPLSINDTLKLHNVWYVEKLEYNLLSVSQLCENGYLVNFNAHGCEIKEINLGRLIVEGNRIENNLYDLREVKGKHCLFEQVNNSWLWHKWKLEILSSL